MFWHIMRQEQFQDIRHVINGRYGIHGLLSFFRNGTPTQTRVTCFLLSA